MTSKNPWYRAMGWFGKQKRTNLERLMARALVEFKVPFAQQVPIGPYFVDFYLPELHTIVEVDGAFWHKGRRLKDEARDRYLRACGYQVYRWDEWSVRRDANACVRAMLRAPTKAMGGTGIVLGSQHGRDCGGREHPEASE